jgi:hypothetical protein
MMTAWLDAAALLASEAQDQAQHFSDVIDSWPVQFVLFAFYAGLAVLAFSRVSRAFTDDLRWFRAVVIALGVFVALRFLFGGDVLGQVMWPIWIQRIVVLWMSAMYLYYIIRFMTKVRPGPPDAVAQARGSALDDVLDEAEADMRHPPA